MQGLELLVTVLLARNRQPHQTVTAGVPPAELAAELVSLPSGLLAMVCEAIGKLKVRLGAVCAPVGGRVCAVPVGDWGGGLCCASYCYQQHALQVSDVVP